MRKYVLALLIVVGLAALLAPAAVGKGPPPPGGRVLVQGSRLHGSSGLAFDSEDRLHIASVASRQIVVMDPKTGRMIDTLGTDLGVEGPDDIAFGPDGSLYWTSFLTGEVGRLSPDGTKSGQFVALGVNPITFSDDGRLFVALFLLGDALYELDADLVAPPRLIAQDIGMVNGMDFGPDGMLYAPRLFLGDVVRIDVDADPVRIEVVVTGLVGPSAVAFDSQGRLHAIESHTGRVLRLDTETGDYQVIATLAPGLDNLAFDPLDRLFISDLVGGSIRQILPSGEARMVSREGMILPGGVAVLGGSDGRESAFVADLFSLREFDGLTGRPKSIERSLFGITGLTSPFTVSPDGENLVVSSWFGNAVQVFDPETGVVLENHLDFAVPLNAMRFEGDLVVAELGTGSVVRRIDGTGERVTLVGPPDVFVPVGLAATDDDLWVGDWATGSVLQIVADGEPLSEPIPVATGLSNPEGLAVDQDGHLLVVESGAGCLSRIDLTTGEVTTVAEGLELGAEGVPGYPPTWMFNGVAVGPSGAIYVTGDIANVLYRFRPLE